MVPTKIVLHGADGSVVSFDDFDMSKTTLTTVVLTAADGSESTIFPVSTPLPPVNGVPQVALPLSTPIIVVAA